MPAGPLTTHKRLQLRRSRSAFLVLLAAISASALLLPRAWTGRLMSLVQVLVPIQDAANVVVDSASTALHRQRPAVSGDEHEALRRRQAAMEHRVAALTAQVAALEQDNRLLTATRLWEVDGQRIGARGSLIPARVVIADIHAWRSSRLINAGTLQGVRRGDAVISDFFNIDRGQTVGVRDGMRIVLAETFVGIVEQSGTHTARVKLLCDIDVQMKVRIARFAGEEFVPIDRYYWLRGRGRGIMEIRDVDGREIAEGVIQVNDVVLSDPTSDWMPASMTIGRISAIRPDRDNPLLRILTVESEIDPGDLHRVYVFDPDSPPGD